MLCYFRLNPKILLWKQIGLTIQLHGRLEKRVSVGADSFNPKGKLGEGRVPGPKFGWAFPEFQLPPARPRKWLIIKINKIKKVFEI